MTKKHFIALADALRAEKPGDNWDRISARTWDKAIRARLAHLLKK